MRKQSGHLWRGMLAAGTAMLLAAGCAGPSTRILPRDNRNEYYDTTETILYLEEANPFYLQETLGILTAAERPAGSRGETEAARGLLQMLSDYGYEVSRQRFRVWDGAHTNEVTGTNVVAVRRAYAEDADILVIGTHHDTAAGSPGANDNAAGVAAWLETARLVSKLPTDTELRFVSFSGTGDGWIGSRYYVDSLSRKERERIIGMIQIDAIGYAEFPDIVLGTRDGEATMLGDLLKSSCWNVLGETWQYERREDSDMFSFVQGQVPAVCITQKRSGYEAGTPLDRMDTVDIERVARLTDVVTQTAAQVISSDTPSMIAKSRFMNNLRDGVYVQYGDSPLGFGDTREEVEKRLHMTGARISSHEDLEGRSIEGFQYQMKWFDVDQVILTNYYYVDGRLDSITLDADGAGVDFEDMKERLESWYGGPDRQETTPDGTAYGWTDPLRRQYTSLVPGTDGFTVELDEFQPEAFVCLRMKPDGTQLEQTDPMEETTLGSAFAHREVLLKRIREMLPEASGQPGGYIDQIVLYTDGLGAGRGHLNVVQEGDEEQPEAMTRRVELWVDLEDALYPDGSWRDETGTEKMLAGLYAEAMEHFRTRAAVEFARRFPADSGRGTDVQVGVRPGEQARDEGAPPGFAESFVYFVLSEELDPEPGAWNERILFFHEDPELEAYRELVRTRLGLSTAKLRQGE